MSILLKTEYTLIPAQPGFYLLAVSYIDDLNYQAMLLREPHRQWAVIAWRVPEDGGPALPVTLSGADEEEDHYTGILQPDGVVMRLCHGFRRFDNPGILHADLAEWLAACDEDLQAHFFAIRAKQGMEGPEAHLAALQGRPYTPGEIPF